MVLRFFVCRYYILIRDHVKITKAREDQNFSKIFDCFLKSLVRNQRQIKQKSIKPGISKNFYLFSRKNKTFTHMYFCTSLFAKEKNIKWVIRIRLNFVEIMFRSHRVALCIEEHLKSQDKPVLRPIAVERESEVRHLHNLLFRAQFFGFLPSSIKKHLEILLSHSNAYHCRHSAGAAEPFNGTTRDFVSTRRQKLRIKYLHCSLFARQIITWRSCGCSELSVSVPWTDELGGDHSGTSCRTAEQMPEECDVCPHNLATVKPLPQSSYSRYAVGRDTNCYHNSSAP